MRKQFNEEKKAREAERLRIYDQAVKDGFSRSVAKEKAKALAEDKARKDLVIELKEAEEEAKKPKMRRKWSVKMNEVRLTNR